MAKMTPQQKAAQTRKANKEKAAQQAAQQAPEGKAPEGKERFAPLLYRPTPNPGGRASANGVAFKTFYLLELTRRTLSELPTDYASIVSTIANQADVSATKTSATGWAAWWRKNKDGSGIPKGCKVHPIHQAAHAGNEGKIDVASMRRNYVATRALVANMAYPTGEPS